MKDTDTMMPPLATGVVTRQIEVNGVRVTYHEAGQSNTSCPPIVMVHGSSGTTRGHFGFLFPMLAVRHRVISVDLANPVTGDDPLELEHLEAQVLAVIANAVPDQEITLLGYSLGAAIAGFTAARHPKIVCNLVLLAGWMKTDMQQLLFNRVWHELRALKSPKLDDFTVYGAFGAPFLSSKTFEDLAGGAAMPLDDFVDKQMELNSRIDIVDLVPDITATTLIIACSYDMMVPVHHSRALFGTIENARYAELASGHAVVFERPAEALRLIDLFAANPQEYPAGATLPVVRP
ncbi:MAG: alpha/beta hydrolase [Rhodobacteraceae bacterium]|nr:MAG: alpha/beta hydrolase [Paracoccaceae bacterium]